MPSKRSSVFQDIPINWSRHYFSHQTGRFHTFLYQKHALHELQSDSPARYWKVPPPPHQHPENVSRSWNRNSRNNRWSPGKKLPQPVWSAHSWKTWFPDTVRSGNRFETPPAAACTQSYGSLPRQRYISEWSPRSGALHARKKADTGCGDTRCHGWISGNSLSLLPGTFYLSN